MSPQTIFIDHDDGSVTNGLVAIRGTRLIVHVCFRSHDSHYIQPNGTTGKLVAKLPGNQLGAALIFDNVWAVIGTGNGTRYVFEAVVENAQIAAMLLGKDVLHLEAQVEWKLTAEAEPRRSMPFGIDVFHGPAQSTDGLPTAGLDAAFAWLVATVIAGVNVGLTPDSGAKTLTISAAGGGGGGTTDHGALIGREDDDHLQYHTDARGDARYAALSHTHTKSQVGLANVDNTSDASKLAAALAAGFARFVDFHNNQPLTQVDRRQITVNAGLDVTLHAELISPNTNVTSGSWFAFTLPRQFSINHAYLTCAFDNEASALMTGALLKQESDGGSEVNLVTITNNEVTFGRLILVENGELVCAAGSRIAVSLSSVVPPYSGSLQGLSLWLHGYWSS